MEVGFETEKLKNDGKRKCWNWQTGMTKDHVSTDVRVQVPFSALKLIEFSELFCYIVKFSKLTYITKNAPWKTIAVSHRLARRTSAL